MVKLQFLWNIGIYFQEMLNLIVENISMNVENWSNRKSFEFSNIVSIEKKIIYTSI